MGARRLKLLNKFADNLIDLFSTLAQENSMAIKVKQNILFFLAADLLEYF